jgi:hypothetical protein
MVRAMSAPIILPVLKPPPRTRAARRSALAVRGPCGSRITRSVSGSRGCMRVPWSRSDTNASLLCPFQLPARSPRTPIRGSRDAMHAVLRGRADRRRSSCSRSTFQPELRRPRPWSSALTCRSACCHQLQSCPDQLSWAQTAWRWGRSAPLWCPSLCSSHTLWHRTQPSRLI